MIFFSFSSTCFSTITIRWAWAALIFSVSAAKSAGFSIKSMASDRQAPISHEMEERISAALGDPQWDPHGDPIPSRDLRMPSDHSLPLTELRAGQWAIVRRVHSQEPRLLRNLRQLGITPGAEVKVLDTARGDQAIRLQVDRSRGHAILDLSAAKRIYLDIK